MRGWVGIFDQIKIVHFFANNVSQLIRLMKQPMEEHTEWLTCRLSAVCQLGWEPLSMLASDK